MTVGIAPPGNRFASVARGGPDVGPAVGGTLGRLLRPAEAGEDDRVWTVDPQAVEATPAGIARVLVHAGRRELSAAAVRLWPPSSHPYSQVRRWPAPGRHAGLVGAAVHAVAGGIIVQFGARSSVPSLLDVVVEDSGTQGARLRLRPTREGGVVAPVATADGPAMLRVGIVGAASDPVRAFRALEVVRGRVADLAPRPIGMGQRGQLRWTLEQRLPGRVARRLDADQLARLAAAWTDLPAAPGPAKAVVTDLLRIALLVPRHTSHVRHVLAHLGPPTVPGVARHGDLWHGNVLVDDGCLVGVVDWGSWHPAGFPGTDLLHLFAMAHRRRGESLGALWLRRPWTWPDFVRLVGPTLRDLDVDVGSRGPRAAGHRMVGQCRGRDPGAAPAAGLRRGLDRGERDIRPADPVGVTGGGTRVPVAPCGRA